MTDEPELTGPLRAFQSYFTGPEHRTRRLRMIFLVLFVGAWFAEYTAVWSFREDFRQHGDYLTMGSLMEEDRVFPRWLIGSALITEAYKVAQQEPGMNPVRFVHRASRWSYLATGIVVVLIFPTWAAFMALTCPMLLQFGAGYSEYYPFISPLFVGLALGHLDRRFDGWNPWVTGAACATLLLVYVGFLPLACMIGGYALARDPKQWWRMLAAGVIAADVLATSIYGAGFASRLWSDLNRGDMKFIPHQDGWAIPGTPFFRPARALDQLPGFFAMVIRGVGIGPLFAGVALSLRERRLTVLVVVYLVVSIFTIPRLGPLGDTDLYFQLYALVGLSIGRALDTSPLAPRPDTVAG